jgi:hypothetical protein
LIDRTPAPGEPDGRVSRLKVPQPELMALLGGTQVMIESPLITELLAKTRQEDILEVLAGRFGKVPREVAARLRAVVKEKELKALVRFAAQCPDLAAFRERLLA